jgi:2-hydroxychromene-2-carboxylate isomerase
MMKPSFEMWIELASTYSDVAVHVAERAAAARGVGITWSEEASRRGVFGAPSMLIGDELFWGQDRIDDALTWYLSREGQS